MKGDEFRALLSRATAVVSGQRAPVSITAGSMESGTPTSHADSCKPADTTQAGKSSKASKRSRRKELAEARKIAEEQSRRIVLPAQRRQKK